MPSTWSGNDSAADAGRLVLQKKHFNALETLKEVFGYGNAQNVPREQLCMLAGAELWETDCFLLAGRSHFLTAGPSEIDSQRLMHESGKVSRSTGPL